MGCLLVFRGSNTYMSPYSMAGLGFQVLPWSLGIRVWDWDIPTWAELNGSQHSMIFTIAILWSVAEASAMRVKMQDAQTCFSSFCLLEWLPVCRRREWSSSQRKSSVSLKPCPKVVLLSAVSERVQRLRLGNVKSRQVG